MKKCTKCKRDFPATEEYFYKQKVKDGYNLSSWCKECQKESSRKYNKEHKEERHEKYKEYYDKDKERYIENGKRWKKENRDKYLVIVKEWKDNNRDRLNGYSRNRGQNKKHKISKKEWIACKEYFNNSCAYCGLHHDDHYRMWSGELKKMDLHKEHVDDEGANDLSNCVPACQSCNSSKWVFKLDEWYNESNEKFSQERLDKIHKWLNTDYKKYIKVNLKDIS